MLYVLTLVIGAAAGLRALTPLAAVSWAAALGALDLSGGMLALLGWSWAPYILTLLALAELVTDQLPQTPSRTVPLQFGTRLVAGALAGAALASPADAMVLGGVLGAIGAVLGTYLGAEGRARLAARLGRDRPAALIEDAITILLTLAVTAVVAA